MHEQLSEPGTAFAWVEESGVAHMEVQPFTLHVSLERGVNKPVPPKPEEYPIPWKTVEEFRARSAELREKLRDARSDAKAAEENAHRKEP